VERREAVTEAASNEHGDTLMARLTGSIAIALVIGILVSSIQAGEGQGEWLQFRHDRALTGRTSLTGHIRQPAVKWKQFAGARETLAAVRFSGHGNTALSLPAVDEHADTWGAVLTGWGAGAALMDLDGDGKSQEIGESPQHRTGKFLPDRPGLQKVVFDSLFNASDQGSARAVGRLLARRNGGWEPLWSTESIPLLYAANPITGDFDRDGQLEVAVTPWYDLWILDLTTGRLEAKARYTPPGAESGRAYGWLGAFDLDGDGRREFVILGDFENFFAVLGWKDGKLAPIWTKLIERGITLKKTILRTGVLPVQDLDGDGLPEIVVSLFNGGGDGRWHTLALEGMTGRTKLDLPDQTLSGFIDVDGDGAVEMACTATRGSLIPERSTLSVIGFKGRTPLTRWREGEAEFQVQPLAKLPAHVNTNGGTGTTTLLTVVPNREVPPIFITRRSLDPSAGRIELSAWQSDKQGQIRRLGRVAGPHLEALAGHSAASGECEILVRARVPGDDPEHLSLSEASARSLAARRVGMPVSSPVIGRLAPSSVPSVVVQGACERLIMFQPHAAQLALPAPVHVPGRGIYTGSGRFAGGASFGGVVLADLLGNGTLAAVAATRAEDGHARLVAYGSGGQEIWHHDFPDLPGAIPEWNIGGLTLWFSGHFTHPRRCDVLVSIRRSTMHSDETLLLDGRTGNQVWHRIEGGNAAGNQRACGGSWMAVYDHDGDGLDDALCLYPDVVSVLEGRSGRLLLDRHTNHDVFKETWTLYAVPAVTDFLHRGRPQILYGANSTVFGVLSTSGLVAWKHGPSPGWPDILPGIGDFDGDGAVELLSAGNRGPVGSSGQEVRCYDAAAGQLEWMLPLVGPNLSADGNPPMTPATGDIDGDGRDEAVFSAGKTLFAIGSSPDGKAGVLRWSLPFPDVLGPAAIADTSGRGVAEIVVVCSDGNVYGVGDLGDPSPPGQ